MFHWNFLIPDIPIYFLAGQGSVPGTHGKQLFFLNDLPDAFNPSQNLKSL
jgi:hypothetical protein